MSDMFGNHIVGFPTRWLIFSPYLYVCRFFKYWNKIIFSGEQTSAGQWTKKQEHYNGEVYIHGKKQV